MKQTPQQEVEALNEYVRLHHAHAEDFSALPEKTMNGLFNRLSPEARAIVKQNKEFVQNFRDSGGREMPFEPKHSIDDMHIPAHSRAAMAKSDSEDVVRGIHERMGTPTASAVSSQQSSAPPDLRETISASFDAEGA